MTRRRLGAFLLLALVASPACRRGAAPAVPPAERPNVLLVTIDTLRADRVGCYGHASASTPVLDALAARGVRFETAIAHVPLTGPSHASILTGLGPLGHGFRENAGFVLPAQAKSGAEDFRAGGLPDGGLRLGVPPRPPLRLRPWLRDLRRPPAEGQRPPPDAVRRAPRRRHHRGRAPLARPDGGACRRAAAARSSSGSTTTTPTRRTSRRATSPRASGRAPYDGEVAFVDQQLGRLLRALEERGVLARTLVVAMSDHGEGLGEHGEGTHGLFVYDSTLKVPFIVAGPGIGGGRVARTVARGIDVLPSLLDYAGLKSRPEIEGRSLRPAIEGREMSDAPAYAETLYPQREFGWAPLLRLAHRAAQDDRGPAPRALRPREGPGGDREPCGKRERAPRRDAAEAGGRALAHGPLGRGRGRPRGRGEAARPGLRGRGRRGPASPRGPLSATPRTASASCRGSTAACRWCAPTPRRRSAT